jgi:hypothetical protein
MVQHEAGVIRLGERGAPLADISSLFVGCRDCSCQNNLSVGQMGCQWRIRSQFVTGLWMRPR